jgi:hypothetical protein
MTDKPLYRVTRDAQWLDHALLEAEHLFIKNTDGRSFCITHDQEASLCAPRTGDLVWDASLDRGTYSATVTRVAPYHGLLLLTRGEETVLQRPVSMMYNAEFGPDMEDVQTWQALAVKAADDDYRRRGETPPPGRKSQG